MANSGVAGSNVKNGEHVLGWYQWHICSEAKHLQKYEHLEQIMVLHDRVKNQKQPDPDPFDLGLNDELNSIVAGYSNKLAMERKTEVEEEFKLLKMEMDELASQEKDEAGKKAVKKYFLENFNLFYNNLLARKKGRYNKKYFSSATCTSSFQFQRSNYWSTFRLGDGASTRVRPLKRLSIPPTTSRFDSSHSPIIKSSRTETNKPGRNNATRSKVKVTVFPIKNNKRSQPEEARVDDCSERRTPSLAKKQKSSVPKAEVEHSYSYQKIPLDVGYCGNGHWEIEKIEDHRLTIDKNKNNIIQYKVKWKLWPKEHNSWIDEDAFADDVVIKKYWKLKIKLIKRKQKLTPTNKRVIRRRWERQQDTGVYKPKVRNHSLLLEWNPELD